MSLAGAPIEEHLNGRCSRYSVCRACQAAACAGLEQTLPINLALNIHPKLALLHTALESLAVPVKVDADDRVFAQKAVWLAQRGGAHLGYSFGWYAQGPLSLRLAEDYYELAAALEMGQVAWTFQSPGLTDACLRISSLFDVPAHVDLSDEDWLLLVASVDYLGHATGLSDQEMMPKIKRPWLLQHITQAREALWYHELRK